MEPNHKITGKTYEELEVAYQKLLKQTKEDIEALRSISKTEYFMRRLKVNSLFKLGELSGWLSFIICSEEDYNIKQLNTKLADFFTSLYQYFMSKSCELNNKWRLDIWKKPEDLT